MAEINIRDQTAKYNADARDRAAKIESDKAIFLPDYQRMEAALEKQLNDPGLPFNQRMLLGDRLTNLKLNWQRNGIGDPNVVIAMRDSILGTLKEAGTMSLDEETTQAIFGTSREKLPRLNAIIAEAKSKGLI